MGSCTSSERFQLEGSHQQSWTSYSIVICVERWIARNKYVHVKTAEEKLAKENEEVDSAICKWFGTFNSCIRECNSYLFKLPVATRLKQPLDRKKLWLECLKTAKIGWDESSNQCSINSHNSTNLEQLLSSSQTPLVPIHKGRRPHVRLQRRQVPMG